ncbi:leukocyte elastase inhibitor-like isoform X1 [Anabas testudineus]|nr:leukocyte elastase inhibitor-like isoform X1 [Anabas testudineus]XP_026218854.1 leukocyte elastase inhibitor-like isoform X1 [Anabas testudineus]
MLHQWRLEQVNAPVTDTMASSTPLTKANTSFSLDLAKKLGDNDKTANIFYSPFSISSALAMVMLGARGNTATQMSEVLHFTEAQQPKQEEAQQQLQTQSSTQSQMQSQIQTRMQMRTQIQQSSRLPQYLLKCLKPQDCQDDLHAHFAQLLSELNKPDAPYSLSVANRLYGEKSYQFVEEFLAKTRKHYSAELEPVDFKTKADEVRVNINNWVDKQTHGKIKDLLAQGTLNSMTILLLVNAIYFKGSWNERFREDSTVDAQFRINKNDTKMVKMMCQKNDFPLASIPEAACQILEMPYKGKVLSMLIFLPNEIEDDTTGLEKLEKELTYEKFEEWTHPAKMFKTEVEVKLPRFKLEATYDLNEVLKSMGMVDVFDDTKSDLSGISLTKDLFLSKVVHKAFVEVNEEGTEAAAATAVMITACAFRIPASFNADHPFLFFIRHNPTKSVLFAGRYSSPK